MDITTFRTLVTGLWAGLYLTPSKLRAVLRRFPHPPDCCPETFVACLAASDLRSAQWSASPHARR